MLGEALQAQEAIWLEERPDRYVEHSKYIVSPCVDNNGGYGLTVLDYLRRLPALDSNIPDPPHDWSVLVGLYI